LTELKEKIVAYAVELRLNQKRRLATPDGAAQDAAKDMEWIARKKLNDLVDLYLHTQEKEAQQVEPLKER
jgi:hypothetical protein